MKRRRWRRGACGRGDDGLPWLEQVEEEKGSCSSGCGLLCWFPMVVGGGYVVVVLLCGRGGVGGGVTEGEEERSCEKKKKRGRKEVTAGGGASGECIDGGGGWAEGNKEEVGKNGGDGCTEMERIEGWRLVLSWEEKRGKRRTCGLGRWRKSCCGWRLIAGERKWNGLQLDCERGAEGGRTAEGDKRKVARAGAVERRRKLAASWWPMGCSCATGWIFDGRKREERSRKRRIRRRRREKKNRNEEECGMLGKKWRKWIRMGRKGEEEEDDGMGRPLQRMSLPFF